ncbi:NADH-quinone oxidoreductase subunit N [Flavisolibacter ginsengisoli]|jgi:NADH-quinone oxidoreductase subunit N|uniref:NADH-quinone oxidoreductase subunit N n=1 Tax=Flavisolibacter ginsengisoli DSM 18119 TaxID=1121884 RepID=A0A1M4TZ77_9BACT|nr:NADH-quinone oxidoreductase subunit N [Flavisolibacter ginsengisoli]SHE49821.1 NADH dehydrogenase subunit N [Flavisolibacter ginsengisoli DSM 18119]
MLNDFFILMKQELTIAVIIFILLFLKLGKDRSNETIMHVVNALLLFNVIFGFIGNSQGILFNEMYRTNPLMVLEKNILSLAMLIISMQSWSWLKTHKHVIEFYLLLLSTLLGMFFMISGGTLLMFYLGLELSTIPLAAAANFNLTKRQSSEAAMKLIISSAFSSGLLLFGISMIYGTTGTLVFSQLPQLLTNTPLQIFAFILLLAGFAFKISVAPFHLWTADVYEGAPVAVTSYLSVVSKGAVLFVFVSVLYTVFKPLATAWYNMLFILSLLTIITGNLFAIRQDNFKRFLAFSSIAQVGFILIGITGSSQTGSTSVIYFVLIYVFSNLAAFGVVSLVSALTGKEKISDYKSFYKTNPVLSWILTIALFSLAGVPPTAGFFGKFFLLLAGASKGNYLLITIASLNMIISFYYYLRIVKAIFMDPNEQPIAKITIPVFPRIALYACVIGVLFIGLFSYVYEYIHSLNSPF